MYGGEGPCGVMVKVLDYGLNVSEYELQSFTLDRYATLYLLSYVLNSFTAVLQGWLWH